MPYLRMRTRSRIMNEVWLTAREERCVKPPGTVKRKKKGNYTLRGSYKLVTSIGSPCQVSASRSKLQTKISTFLLPGVEKDNEDFVTTSREFRPRQMRSNKLQSTDTCGSYRSQKRQFGTVFQALEQYKSEHEKQDIATCSKRRNTTSETSLNSWSTCRDKCHYLNEENWALDDTFRRQFRSSEAYTSSQTESSCVRLQSRCQLPVNVDTRTKMTCVDGRQTSAKGDGNESSSDSNSPVESHPWLPYYDPVFYQNCTERNTQGEDLPPITSSLIYQALGTPDSLLQVLDESSDSDD